jgi:hypothetical protein
MAMSNPGISKIEFAADLTQEEDGFELLVPLQDGCALGLAQ